MGALGAPAEREGTVAVKVVLLDIDGTLLLSNDAHAQTWVEAFAAFGYSIAYERVRPMIGMGGERVIPALVPGLTDQEGVGKQVTERRKELVLTRYAPTLRPAPGARALLQHMRQAGLTLAVATSATGEELQALLKAAGVADLTDQETTSDDAERAKPDPDIIVAALRKVKVSPDEAIMLGDTPYDVQAARKAGVRAIGVRCGGWDDAQLLAEGAVAVYADPADLLAHYDSSPLHA